MGTSFRLGPTRFDHVIGWTRAIAPAEPWRPLADCPAANTAREAGEWIGDMSFEIRPLQLALHLSSRSGHILRYGFSYRCCKPCALMLRAGPLGSANGVSPSTEVKHV
jgi:hypothetical protein